MELFVKNLLETMPRFINADETRLHYPIDIYSQEDGVGIDIVVAALDQERIKVKLDGNTLRIEYTPEPFTIDDPMVKKYIHKGITRKAFSYDLLLGNTLDSQNLEASFNSGILHVWIPTKPESRPKDIKIKS